LVPLFQPGSKLAGSLEVRVFEAGLHTFEAGVVTKTACGERALGETADINVAPGMPEIFVQDPYDVDVPNESSLPIPAAIAYTCSTAATAFASLPLAPSSSTAPGTARISRRPRDSSSPTSAMPMDETLR